MGLFKSSQDVYQNYPKTRQEFLDETRLICARLRDMAYELPEGPEGFPLESRLLAGELLLMAVGQLSKTRELIEKLGVTR